jgi:hypothetical protein
LRDLGDTVGGKVRDIQQRAETHWLTKFEVSVLSFRVSLFDDVGNLERLVPVEIRGSSFTGALSENDEVRVIGRYKGGVLRAKRIQNLTDGSEVRAQAPAGAKFMFGILFAGIAAFLVFGYWLVGAGP